MKEQLEKLLKAVETCAEHFKDAEMTTARVVIQNMLFRMENESDRKKWGIKGHLEVLESLHKMSPDSHVLKWTFENASFIWALDTEFELKKEPEEKQNEATSVVKLEYGFIAQIIGVDPINVRQVLNIVEPYLSDEQKIKINKNAQKCFYEDQKNESDLNALENQSNEQ